MLSIQLVKKITYYLKWARANYFFRPGNPLGRWWGAGVKALGLGGFVKPSQLKPLSKGFAPDGRPLIQNAGAPTHQKGWDFTFSAPKDLSVFWSSAPRAIRLKIQKLHFKAIKFALNYLLLVAFFTRRGKGGTIRESAKPIVAVFEHGNSHELEPQLHSHCVILNVAESAGTFRTILSAPLFKHKKTAGVLYRAQFDYLLQSELGLQTERHETAFRIPGVSKELVDHHSTRRKQILEELDSNGFHSAKAAAVAALATRKSKDKPPPPRGLLLRRWQETNRKFGFTEEKAQRLLGKVTVAKTPPNLRARIQHSVQALLETEAFFSEQQLIRCVAIEGMGEGVPGAQIVSQVGAYLLNNPEIVALASYSEEPQFTTHEMLALERELFTILDQGKDDISHVIERPLVDDILDRELPLGPQLTQDEWTRNTEQRNAVMKITTKPGTHQVMEGMAGTGKTYTLSVARQVWQKAGFNVTGMALSAIAAFNLQEGSGIESDTIAMRICQLDSRRNFTHHHKRQLKRLLKGKQTYAYDGRSFSLNRKTIVVVDEAGMVGTRQMLKLARHIRRAGAKLVLVGDRRQLQPIDAGGPFIAIAKKVDKADLQHVVRQRIEPDDPNPEWHREAGKLIAAGHSERAIKLFAERGRFSVHANRKEALLAIVRDWSVKGIADPSGNIILAATLAEVAQLNAMCQSARLKAGVFGANSVLIGETEFWQGDTVLFTKTSRVYAVKNGDRGIVLGFNLHTKTMAVRLYATDKTVFVPYQKYAEVQLGYAMTTHKAQGATVPNVYVLLGGNMQDRHLSYVQSTRACESTRLYVDKLNAGPKLKDLLKQMEKARPKKLAHDLLTTNPPGPSGKEPSPREAPANAATLRPSSSKKSRRRKKNRSSTVPPKSGQSKPTRNKELLSELRRQAIQSRGQTEEAPKKQSSEAESKTPTPKKSPPIDSVRFEQLMGQLKQSALQSRDQTNRPKQSADDQNGHSTSPAVSPDSLTSPSQDKQSAAVRDDSVPNATSHPPTRDILDLSHVQITATTDVKLSRAAIRRYGKLPGGILVEGEATCEVPITSLAIDPSRPAHLVVNGSYEYDTGLSAEEVALLWHTVLETGEGEKDFGVLSQTEAIGIANDTSVAVTMMHADNALGGLVYGYDSQFSLPAASPPNYCNPFVSEIESTKFSEKVLERLFFNYVDEINPQVFLTIAGVSFSRTRQGVIVPAKTSITAVLGAAMADGKIATSIYSQPVVQDRFPEVDSALRAVVATFGQCARSEPTLPRIVAYAELVCLLRRAKTEKARLSSRDHVRGLVEGRQHVSLPRFNYTVRSREFVDLASDFARWLAKSKATFLNGLVASTVGLHHASRAGDIESFLVCKERALRCIEKTESNSCHYSHEFISRLPALAERIRNTCHDVVIDTCLNEASKADLAQDDKNAYLIEAKRLCGASQDPIARCRRIEAEAYLDPHFQPIPNLAKVRIDNPASMEPFRTLASITKRNADGSKKPKTDAEIVAALVERKALLGIQSLPHKLRDEWNSITAQRTDKEALAILETLQRLDLPLSEFLEASHQNKDLSPRTIILKLEAARLKSLSAGIFSTRLLSRLNPFLDCDALLDHETPENLERLLTEVRRNIDPLGMSRVQESKVQRVISALKPRNSAQWWYRYLRNHATSKVALLLGHELKLRRANVNHLYQTMRRYGTNNPQSALFYWDYQQSWPADILPRSIADPLELLCKVPNRERQA